MSSDSEEEAKGMAEVAEKGQEEVREEIKGLGTLIPITSALAQVPPGLDFLVPLNTVYVKQEVELLEIVCGCEGNNKYSVKDEKGREIYRVNEDTSCCVRNCCQTSRPFRIILDDFEGHQVIFKRRLACKTCFFPCCLQKLKVFVDEEMIGKVTQQWSCCASKFYVYNEEGHLVYRIQGPCCTTSCCCSDINFKILSANGSEEVGRISKKWGGIIQEAFTDADNFVVLFPVGTEAKTKVTLIGAALLLDFMFYEREGHRRTPRVGR